MNAQRESTRAEGQAVERIVLRTFSRNAKRAAGSLDFSK